MAEDNSISIDELDSKRAPRRTLTLVGPGLPMQGAAWGFEGRHSTTWYQGNRDEATQQWLVAPELPSSWEGSWRLNMLVRAPCRFDDEDGTSSDVTSPQLLRDIIESIGRSGRRLRVTWSVETDSPGGTGRIVREGRMSRFEAKHIATTDIDWSAEFAWMSRGVVAPRVSASRQDNVPSAVDALAAALLASSNAIAFTDIQRHFAGIANSASKFSLGQLEALASYPQTLANSFARQAQGLISQANQVADLVKTVRGEPAAIENAALGVALSAEESADQFADAMDRVPPEVASRDATLAAVARAANYTGDMADSARATARQARATQKAVKSRAVASPIDALPAGNGAKPGDVLAVHLVRDGDTPQKIALRYFGDPDRDVDILRANRLPEDQVTLARGTSLAIPSRPRVLKL